MRKILSKTAALATAASLALVAPTFIPALPFSSSADALVACGFTSSGATLGSAFAAAPCPILASSHIGIRPWPVVAIFVGTAGVMLNAAYVWNTQCRELTSDEAMTSTFLPVVGMFFNKQASKCHH